MKKLDKKELARNIYFKGVEAQVTNEDVNKLADELIQTGVIEFYGAFARDVKQAPIEKLAMAVAKSHQGKYIYEFAVSVESAPIDILSSGLMQCNKTDAKWIHWFANEFEDRGAPKKQLMEKYDQLTNYLIS